MQLRDSLISEVVITSPFIHTDIWDAIEIGSHNGVNITKNETPQSAEKYCAIGMFVQRINIDELKGLVIMFKFGHKDTAFRVDIMADNFNGAPRMDKEAHPGLSVCTRRPKSVTAPLSFPKLTLCDIR